MTAHFTLRMPRQVDLIAALRHDVDAALAEYGIDAEQRADVTLMVSEVCTSVAAHLADGRAYEIAVHADTAGCVVEVHDIDPTAPTEPPAGNVLTRAGYGPDLVTAVTDHRWTRNLDPDGMTRRLATTFTTTDHPAGSTP